MLDLKTRQYRRLESTATRPNPGIAGPATAAGSFYESYLKTFNVPELIRGPIVVKERELAQAVLKPLKILAPKGAGQQVPPGQPAGQGDEGQSNYRPTRE